MFVCACGEVSEYCEKRDMLVVSEYDGDIAKYRGVCRVLVTDRVDSEQEYSLLKVNLLKRGFELVSIHHGDSKVVYDMCDPGEKKKVGRYKFGFGRNGMYPEGKAVVKRIFELSDAGFSVPKIHEDAGVHHPDGRKVGFSTLYDVLNNREIYEKEGLF